METIGQCLKDAQYTLKLAQYDQKHNSELLETLDALVNNGGNIKNTAAALHVHYNTLRYRYQLIKSKTFGFTDFYPNFWCNICKVRAEKSA